MENSNQSNADQEFPYKQTNSVSNAFQSEEAMKAYYLQMADTMILSPRMEKYSEYARLKNLHHRLTQFLKALQYLNEHQWGKGVAEIQEACGVYMLQNNIDRKKLLHFNQEIGQHLLFITQLAENMNSIKRIFGIMNCHYYNVEYIMKGVDKKTKENLEEDAALQK